jgi:hypothetical protein
MRRYNGITTGCITALILLSALIIPVCGLNISYDVLEDGSGYHAVGEVIESDRFDFIQSGMLGERVPTPVTNVSLTKDSKIATFKEERDGIRFEKGNYSVSYDGKINGNTFQVQYIDPAMVTIVLPEKFRVDNPLLTSIQPGGSNISRTNTNQTVIHWDKARYFDIRFYDSNQESLLSIFGQFWFIIAVMLLLPFLFARGRQG